MEGPPHNALNRRRLELGATHPESTIATACTANNNAS
jgi:hypothetical protein